MLGLFSASGTAVNCALGDPLFYILSYRFSFSFFVASPKDSPLFSPFVVVDLIDKRERGKNISGLNIFVLSASAISAIASTIYYK